jgi:dTDP-glucose 4,6-dehydratase
MKNVLVTGGAGFIGSNFIHWLLANEQEVSVVNLDALTYAGSLLNLKELPATERYHFVHGSITDAGLVNDLFHRYQIDTVVHFAAETHVDRSIDGPAEFIQTNIIGTFTLLEAARQAWLIDKIVPLAQARFHHVSTDEVFGMLQPGDPPFHEGTPYSPNSPYAASKASSDHLVRAYHHTYGLPVTISNCTNNYGPRQFPEKLIPLIILNCIQGKPLPVYGDGQQIRDWLYVDDHCRAILEIIQNGKDGETYGIGGNNQPPNLEIIQAICGIVDDYFPESTGTPHADLITFVKDRPGHDRRYAMDIQKINTKLGWKPSHSLAEGLRKTVEWYLSNMDWVEEISQDPAFNEWVEKNYTFRGERL